MTDLSGVPSAPIRPAAAPTPVQTPEEELRDYRVLVEECARLADGRVLFNESKAHAAIIIENIFRASNQTVDILTGELYPPIYGAPEVVEAAMGFLSHSNAVLRIISEKPLDQSHPLLASAAGRGLSERIEKKQISPTARRFHFMLGDGKHFRLEPDKEVFSAVCQFGEPNVGDNLKRAFNNLCNHAVAA